MVIGSMVMLGSFYVFLHERLDTIYDRYKGLMSETVKMYSHIFN